MKKIKLFCDPMVAAMGSIWAFLFTPLYFIIIIDTLYFYENNGIDTIFNAICASLICYIPGIALCVITIKCASIWFAYVKIHSQGIVLGAPLSKKIKFSYNDFRYVKIAYYVHIYQKRFFLVLSRSYITPSQLMNVNQLRCDDTLIKIKITKRRYRTLVKILPDGIKENLVSAWNGELGEDDFNIEAEIKRQHRKQKQKKKRKKRK